MFMEYVKGLWLIWLFIAVGIGCIGYYFWKNFGPPSLALGRAVRALGGAAARRAKKGRLTLRGVSIGAAATPARGEFGMGATEVWAQFANGFGPTFRVHPRKSFDKSPPFGSVPRFDERCVVSCHDEAATRAVWSPRAQELMSILIHRRDSGEGLLGVTDGVIESNGQDILFRRTQPFKRPESYERAFELLAELARTPTASAPPSGRSSSGA